MSDPFIGEVRAVAWDFAPRGWARCDGQLLPIAQNQALFSILGTTYGGDGRVTFALPDLRGRVPVHAGNEIRLGDRAGEAQHTLGVHELPTHNHALLATSAPGQGQSPDGALLAGAKVYAPGSASVPLAPAAVGASGGSQPHDNMQPYLTVNFIIALNGVYPSRT